MGGVAVGVKAALIASRPREMQVRRPELGVDLLLLRRPRHGRIHHARRVDQRRSRIHRNRHTQRLGDLLCRRTLLRGGMHVGRDAPITLTSHADRDGNELPRLCIEVPALVASIAELTVPRTVCGVSLPRWRMLCNGWRTGPGSAAWRPHSDSIHPPLLDGNAPSSAAKIMDPDNRNRSDAFIPYPTDRVVGTLDDAKGVRAAIEALSQAGFARDEIDVLHGEDDLNRLDPTGAEHGFLARFQRTLIRTAGPVEEYRHLTRHVEDVRAGRFVVMVLAKQSSQRRTAAEILSSHGAEFIGFYGRWAYQAFAGDRAGPGDARADSPSARSGDAPDRLSNPAETVKRMLAAFGARDLDALLDTVHPESRWTYFGANPQLSRAEFTGRSQVRRFFERILERLEITSFNTDQFVVEGDTVVIFGSESGTVKATQQPFRNEWSQRYVVQDGLIVEMAEYNVQVEPRS